MRSTVKVLSVAAALAMAVGLSACDEQDIAQPSPGSGSATSSAEPDSGDSDASPSEDSKDDKDGKDAKDTKSKSGETTKSGSKIQDINTVTFRDDEIGLTQTCDKVVEDYAAPKYKQGKSDETVYLLHCTTSMEMSATALASHTLRRCRTRRTPPSRRTSTDRCWPTT